MMTMTKRGLQSVLVLSVSVALMLVQHYGQDDALPSELVTSSASCGRLCQARDMILRAKRSLDKKAQAELMLLKSGYGDKVQLEAALVVNKQQPRPGVETLGDRSSYISKGSGQPRRRREAGMQGGGSRPAMHAVRKVDDRVGAAKTKEAIPAAKAPASHLAASSLTKADLKHFEDRMLQKEREVIAGPPGIPKESRAKRDAEQVPPRSQTQTGLAHHPTWYDTQSGYQRGGRTSYCYDNPRWHGPFGDPCVAYATGGDRAFWCEWDGAGADNACPRSCGTCSLGSYNKEDTSRHREEHLLREHFDPLEAPPDSSTGQGQRNETAAISGETGPVQHVDARREMTGALLREVSQMKEQLKDIAKMTGDMAAEVASSRSSHRSSHRLSARQAASDLANFYAGDRVAVAKENAVEDRLSSNDAKKDLAKDGKVGKEEWEAKEGEHIAVAKENAVEHRLSSGNSQKDLATYWDGQKDGKVAAKKEEREAKKAAIAHRLSSSAASKDLKKYWRAFKHAVAKAKGSKTLLSDKQARFEFDSWWDKNLPSAKSARADTGQGDGKVEEEEEREAKKAAIARRLSSRAAKKDLKKYWEYFKHAVAKAKGKKKHGMSAQDADRDLDAFLSKMVAKARVAHRATLAAAESRRSKTKSDQEAVPSKRISDKQARLRLDRWWNTEMPVQRAEEGKEGQTEGKQEDGAGGARRSKGLVMFSAATAAKQLDEFWDEMFPTPKKARKILGDDKAREGREQRGAVSSGQGGANRHGGLLGLPQGREEAVKINRPQFQTPETARHALDEYFDKEIRRDDVARAKQRLRERSANALLKGADPRPSPFTSQQQYPTEYGNVEQYRQPYMQDTPPQFGTPQLQFAPYAPQQAAAPGEYGIWRPYPNVAQAAGQWEQAPQASMPETPALVPRTPFENHAQSAFTEAYDGYHAALNAGVRGEPPALGMQMAPGTGPGA